MSIQPHLIEGFGFSGTNRTWEAIMVVIDESIEDELATVVSRETVGEERIHAAGRAEALRDLKTALLQLRDAALLEQGIKVSMVDTKDG
jgi:hypothetical protein